MEIIKKTVFIFIPIIIILFFINKIFKKVKIRYFEEEKYSKNISKIKLKDIIVNVDNDYIVDKILNEYDGLSFSENDLAYRHKILLLLQHLKRISNNKSKINTNNYVISKRNENDVFLIKVSENIDISENNVSLEFWVNTRLEEELLKFKKEEIVILVLIKITSSLEYLNLR